MKAFTKLLSISSLLVCGSVPALSGESLDRFGRLIGYGWSDGYHACAEDCYQLGENLPPYSFASQHAIYQPASHHHSARSGSFGSGSQLPCDHCDAHPHINAIRQYPSPEWTGSGSSVIIQEGTSGLPGVPARPFQPVDDSGPDLRPPGDVPPIESRQTTPAKPGIRTDTERLPVPAVDDDPEELPAPKTEPSSPSDIEEARRNARTFLKPISFGPGSVSVAPHSGATKNFPRRLPATGR